MSMLTKFIGLDSIKNRGRRLDRQREQAREMAASGVPEDEVEAYWRDARKGFKGGLLKSVVQGVGRTGAATLGGLGLGGAFSGGGAAAAAAPGAGGGGAAAGGGGGLMGGLKSVGGWAMDNPELIMGAAQAYQGSKDQRKADDLQRRALELAEQPWNETEGLRRQSLKSLMNPTRTDLSGIYGGQSNPFARPYTPQAPVPLPRPVKPPKDWTGWGGNR